MFIGPKMWWLEKGKGWPISPKEIGTAFVFLKIPSEGSFLVSPIGGQEVNLCCRSLGAGVLAFGKHKESPQGYYHHILIT